MATWAKVKFYWDNVFAISGGTLTATSTASGYDVANIHNGLEVNSWKAANTNEPCWMWLDLGQNIVTNGDFETGDTTGWSFLAQGGAAATRSFITGGGQYSGTYSCKVTITAAGTSPADIQLYSKLPHTFEKGKNYVLVFAAKASAARSINSSVIHNNQPWSSLGLDIDVDVTTTYRQFFLPFTATMTTANARVDFQIGGDIADVTIDSVDIYEEDTFCADYVAGMGHNLFTLGADVSLDMSLASDYHKIHRVACVRPASDTILFSESTMLLNGDFDVWPNGTVANPFGWRYSGTGATIAQNTSTKRRTAYGVTVTTDGTSGGLLESSWHRGISSWQTNTLLDLLYLSGKTVAFGAWVFSTTASRVDLQLIHTTNPANSAAWTYVKSSMHSGNGWEWLTVTTTLPAGLTGLIIRLNISAGSAVNATIANARFKLGSTVTEDDTSDTLPTSPWQAYGRYWRIKLSRSDGAAFSAAPYLSMLTFGRKTELDYASSSFDPHAQNAVSEVNISQGGFVSGVFTSYIEREMSLNFQDADAALYAKVKAWWEGNGMKQFFVAWENANNPDDIFLMRPDGRFNNPLTNGGAYRDITINLKGRKA